MPSTWIDNDVIENIFLQTFTQFDTEFSKLFETQASSQEERLTGFFVEKLCSESKKAQVSIQNLLETLKEPWYFSIRYTDMTGTEKKYGADIAFVLRSNIPNKMRREKVILVQCKKMNMRPSRRFGFMFYPSWPIDKNQAEDLCRHTPFGYYFLYGPHSQGILTRVIPARSVVGLLEATGRTTTIPAYQTIVSSRSFPKFFVYDFIGCWVGDEEKEAFRIAFGRNEEFSVRYLIQLDISRG